MRQITGSNPQRGTVHRDVNGADPTLHTRAYEAPIIASCSLSEARLRARSATSPTLPCWLGIPSPRWAVLPPSWLAHGVTRPAVAPEQGASQARRDERATLHALGGLGG